MEFRKASAELRRQEARTRNPALFDRLFKLAKVSHHGECWPVLRTANRDGYGVLKVDGRSQRAHRLMFELYYPGIPAPVVRHNCNNPACINPAHLRAGTPKDNAMDRVNSNRGGDLKGEKNGRAKLTSEQVLEIRASSLSGTELGRKYGVSKNMISRIRLGLAWNHIK